MIVKPYVTRRPQSTHPQYAVDSSPSVDGLFESLSENSEEMLFRGFVRVARCDVEEHPGAGLRPRRNEETDVDARTGRRLF